jgi:hypothetical protein
MAIAGGDPADVHCRVPLGYKANGFPLGQWVSRQRAKARTLSVERRRRLDALGFVWDPFESLWENNFSLLKRYKERKGHCRVPFEYRENGYQLGHWVANLRAKADTLSVERHRRLDKPGFVWRVR